MSKRCISWVSFLVWSDPMIIIILNGDMMSERNEIVKETKQKGKKYASDKIPYQKTHSSYGSFIKCTHAKIIHIRVKWYGKHIFLLSLSLSRMHALVRYYFRAKYFVYSASWLFFISFLFFCNIYCGYRMWRAIISFRAGIFPFHFFYIQRQSFVCDESNIRRWSAQNSAQKEKKQVKPINKWISCV